MRAQFTRAVLLRSVDYGDTDRIVTLLTDELGKLAVIARGARRSQKRFAGSLEPYAIIEAEVAPGRGEVGRLGQARILRAFPGLLRDLSRIGAAAAALELVREVVPSRVPEPRLVDALEHFFEALEASSREELLIAFELRVLGLVGLAPALDACAHCGRAAPSGRAALFDPRAGSIVCTSCGGGPLKLSSGVRSWMLLAQACELAPSLDRQGCASARRALDAFVREHLDRRLPAGRVAASLRGRSNEAEARRLGAELGGIHD